jgi:hypothetical protein
MLPRFAEGFACMRIFNLYNAFLWLTNVALGVFIVLFFFKYLLAQADYTRDVRLEDGPGTPAIVHKPKLSDHALKLTNPIVPAKDTPPVPPDENFIALLKGTLPRQQGDRSGAVFLRSVTMNTELVAFVGEKILFEASEFDEYTGWTLGAVWKNGALFNGPNGRTKELTIGSGVIPNASTPETPDASRSKRLGRMYQSGQFKSRLLASAANRVVWGLDPAEMEWASQNVDRILESDFQVLPNAGGGVRIESVTPGSISAVRGIMAGDVVRDVNGQPLNSIAEARALMSNSALRSQKGLRITVERAGKPVVLEYRPLPR